MRVKVLVVTGFFLSFSIGFMIGQILLIRTQKPSNLVRQIVDRSLDKYTIPNLAQVNINQSQIKTVKELKDYPNFTSNEFIMEANLNLDGKTMKKISGMLNIPKVGEKHPLIIMIRGFVPVNDYFIGNGTINASLFFANHGYMTIAPDFLGYGESDKEPENIFEARFQTYTTVMALLKSLDNVPNWDHKNVFIWAHSNGGNIALTALEATSVKYPTVLWAPVSSSFPFSILYYSDEVEDKGKFLRRELAKFEDVYNTDSYSLNNYLNLIKAPIQINQGSVDTSVPVEWSSALAKTLKDQGLDVNYNLIPNADHQMTPFWNNVIEKDLKYFNDSLEVLPR